MTKEFLTVDEIQKKYGIKDFELFEEIKNGLPVYSKGNLEKPLQWDQIEIDEFVFLQRKTDLEKFHSRMMTRIVSAYPYLINDCLFLESDLEKIGIDTKEPQKTPDIFPIETPPGTTWKQILFTVKNYDRTEIKHPDGRENKLHKEMGLKQRGKENPLPGALLRLYLPMAALNGTFPAQGNIETLKGNMSRLRQCFKSLFPNISGDPIPFINNEYQTAFTLKPDPENFFNQMPDATKDYLEAFTKAANRIKSKKILPD